MTPVCVFFVFVERPEVKERPGQHIAEVNVFIKYITFFLFFLTLHLNYKSVHTHE